MYINPILITGGTGYFGRAFVSQLLKGDCDRVCIFSRNEHAQADMRAWLQDDSRCRWFIGDVRDRERLTMAMEGVDIVVHAAALKRIEVGFYNPHEMKKTNVDGAENVIQAATAAGVKKVVALSSDKAYEPVSMYGHSKAMAEALFLSANNTRGKNGPIFAVCRYGNIWCSTGSVVPIWINLIAAGATKVPVSDPDCTRFFMRRDEAVALVMDTAERMTGGELRIPDLPAYRVGDLATAMGMEMHIYGLQVWEKKHEKMDANRCSEDARRMSVVELKEALRDA